MLRKILLLLLTITAITTTAWAQIPEFIAPPRFEATPRTPEGCAEGNAGGTIRTLGARNKNLTDVRYLCLGDTLFLNTNGQANLTNDSVAATPSGIGYFFYSCKPTIAGPRFTDFVTDACLFRNPLTNFLVASRGEPSGRDTFFNAGTLQTAFNGGRPVKFYFAPVTMTDFFGLSGGSQGFDNSANCINANVNDRMNPTDTFSVVYLNAVRVTVERATATGGRFAVTGGLPQYDGTSTYTFTIRLASNPAIVGTITNGASAGHNGTVTFTVPQTGTYIITATDGKSCDGQATELFQDVPVQVSNEFGRQNDTVCVKVSANNFTNMLTMQGTIQFDPSVVEWVGARNSYNLDGFDPSFFIQANASSIGFSWNGPAGGTTLPNGSGLFDICFRVIGANGTVSPIRITDSTTPIELANRNNTVVGYTITNGSISSRVLDYAVTTRADSARCFGELGKFTIKIVGLGPPFNYSWQSATNPGQNGTGVIATAADSAIILNRLAGKYYITVTNVSNIQKIDSVEVKQPNVVFLNSPTAVNPTCANSTDGSLTLTGFGGGTPNYTFLWTTGATTSSISGLASGAYGVTITDSKGCKDSVPRVSIGVNPISIVNSQKTDATCKGLTNGAVTISAVQGGTSVGGSYTFRWSTGATNVGTSSTISGLAPSTYYVTIIDRNNCEKRDSFKINAIRTLQASATIGNIACFGQANGFINVTASATGNEATPYTFTWTGNVGTPRNLPPATSIVSSLRAATYFLRVTDNSGCPLDTSFTIREPDSIRINLVTLTNESCRGGNSNGAVTVAVSGGTPQYKYAWSRNAALDTFPTITGLRAGSYTLTVTDSAGCIKTRVYTILPPVLPIIDSFQIKNATCADRRDASARVFYRPGTGTLIDSVRWSNTGFLDSITNILAGNYTVTITANNGCQRIDTARVSSPELIKVDSARSSKLDPPCPQQPIGRITLVMKGGTAPYSYNWSGGPTQSGAVFASLSAGTYTFTVTDSNGCTADTSSVTLIDPPTVQVAFADIVGTSCYATCDGEATISASGGAANTGVYSFNWSSGEVCNNVTTCKAVRLCGGWQQVIVSDQLCVYPPDSVFIPRPDSFTFITPPVLSPSCKGDRDGSAEIRPQGGTLPYSYLWSNGSTRNNIVNVRAGTYTVTVTDANFCPFTLAVTITEPDSLKIDTIPFQSKNVSCFGLANGEIKLRRTGGNGAAAQTNYNWTPSVSQGDSAKSLKAGPYTIIATDAKGCRDSLTINLTQPDPIFFFLPPLTQPRCNGELTTLRIDTAFGSTYKYPFSVSVDNGPQYPIGYFIPVFAGRHEINIIEQVTGCTLDTSVTVSEPPALTIRFDTLNLQNQISKILVGLGDSARINPLITSALPIDSVSWTPKTYLSFRSDPLRPFTRPLDDITYKLTIVDVNGCSTSESIFVELDRNRNIFIPNVFSPNGDDRNDYFGVFNGVGVKMINFVRVFDRWGELMFTKSKILPGTDISQGWDGTFRGRVVENGVYVYMIEVEFEDGQKLLYRGDITVVR